MESCSTKT